MKKLLKLCLLIVILMTTSCNQDSIIETLTDSKKASKSTVDVYNVINGTLVGTSTLHRNKNGITVNFKTTDLTPGYAYTLWWVIWNKPQNCIGYPAPCGDLDFAIADQVEVEVLYATGHVVGNSGIGNFSAHINENDDTGSVNALFGLPLFGGLNDAETAEVHMVLRSHGPAVPGLVNEQIGGYLGGCTTFFPPFTEIPDEVGECGDFEASIHQPVN